MNKPQKPLSETKVTMGATGPGRLKVIPRHPLTLREFVGVLSSACELDGKADYAMLISSGVPAIAINEKPIMINGEKFPGFIELLIVEPDLLEMTRGEALAGGDQALAGGDQPEERE